MSEAAKSIEVELKLILPGNQVEELIVDYLCKNNYTVEKISPLTNTDIYMDTSDWMLLKNSLSLRYRLSNNEAMYTVKSIGTIEDGIAKRTETEIKLEKPVQDPTEISIKQIKQQIDAIIYPRKLLEQILIRTNRRRYLASSPAGAKFELSFDTSSFSSDALFKPQPAAHLHEFEAELVEGPVTAVKTLASILSKAFGYVPSTTSKLQYAITRLRLEPIVKQVPENLRVHLDDRLDVALKKILAVEFTWLRQQFPGVAADRDPEFVHQARVAARRMRSALMLFPGALPEQTVAYIDAHLKWLGGLFGDVRDLDVFMINLSAYSDKIESFLEAKRKALETLVAKQRRDPLKAINDALISTRYKNFERSMTEFLETPAMDYPESPTGQKLIREVAPLAVTDKFENVIEQGKKMLADPQLTEFHCLRIQMKRLRYTLEFLAPPYGGAFDDIIHRTVGIQDCLGQLQDTVFNQKLIKKIIKKCDSKLVGFDLIFILGEIYQYQGEIARDCKEKFNKIWERFSSNETSSALNQIFAVKQPKAKPARKPLSK